MSATKNAPGLSEIDSEVQATHMPTDCCNSRRHLRNDNSMPVKDHVQFIRKRNNGANSKSAHAEDIVTEKRKKTRPPAREPEHGSKKQLRKLLDCVAMKVMQPLGPRGVPSVVMLDERFTPYPKRGAQIENLCGMFATFVEIGMLRGLVVDTITPFGVQHMLYHVEGNITVDQGRAFFKACRRALVADLGYPFLTRVLQGVFWHRGTEPELIPGDPQEPGAHDGPHGSHWQACSGGKGWLHGGESGPALLAF